MYIKKKLPHAKNHKAEKPQGRGKSTEKDDKKTERKDTNYKEGSKGT